jgi:hypothetical protein
MDKVIHLIGGGPLDNQWVAVPPDHGAEYIVVSPDWPRATRGYHDALTDATPIPTRTGVYRRLVEGSRYFHWQGFKEEAAT